MPKGLDKDINIVNVVEEEVSVNGSDMPLQLLNKNNLETALNCPRDRYFCLR